MSHGQSFHGVGLGVNGVDDLPGCGAAHVAQPQATLQRVGQRGQVEVVPGGHGLCVAAHAAVGLLPGHAIAIRIQACFGQFLRIPGLPKQAVGRVQQELAQGNRGAEVGSEPAHVQAWSERGPMVTCAPGF